MLQQSAVELELESTPAGETPLHIGAARGREAAVRCLIDEGDADVDAADDSGAEPGLLGFYRRRAALA